MTPIEAAAAAQELAERLERLARNEAHLRTNAVAIQEDAAAAAELVEALGAFLVTFEVPA